MKRCYHMESHHMVTISGSVLTLKSLQTGDMVELWTPRRLMTVSSKTCSLSLGPSSFRHIPTHWDIVSKALSSRRTSSVSWWANLPMHGADSSSTLLQENQDG